jgi:hypothetical protein
VEQAAPAAVVMVQFLRLLLLGLQILVVAVVVVMETPLLLAQQEDQV